jgi:DNA-directed RNA polymerase specialized sigma24 family protein
MMDQLQDSFSEIMRGVASGDSIAEQQLWNAFYEKLLEYIERRVRLRGTPAGLIDEELVTVSVMESIFKCAKLGRLQNMQDWSEFSSLLFAIANRKFVDHWRRATARKAYPGAPPNGLPVELVQEKMTDVAIIFNEEIDRLMALLPDDLFRDIAVLKLAGYTSTEISEKVQRSVPTVTRKWGHIRRLWADELQR